MLRSPPNTSNTGKKPVHISECNAFASLARQAEKFDAIDRALRQTLPLPLREQVRFALFRNGKLVFLATSSVWASRLRLQQGYILDMAHAIGLTAHSIDIKVTLLPLAPVMTFNPLKPLPSDGEMSPEKRHREDAKPEPPAALPMETGHAHQ